MFISVAQLPFPLVTKIRLFLFIPIGWMAARIDLKHGLLPDFLTVSGLLLSIILVLPFRDFDLIRGSVLGAVVASGFMLFLYLITRRKGIGLGDVKFSAMAGGFSGLWGSIMFLKVAFFIGGAMGILLVLSGRRSMKSRIRFGPMLGIGGLVGILYADADWFAILEWPF